MTHLLPVDKLGLAVELAGLRSMESPVVQGTSKPDTLVEPAPDRALSPARQLRLMQLERLVIAIEDELSDEQLDDEQKLQNIGERLANATDGR